MRQYVLAVYVNVSSETLTHKREIESKLQEAIQNIPGVVVTMCIATQVLGRSVRE